MTKLEIDRDLISRKAAVSRISDLIVLELRGEHIPTWNEVYKALGELPTVDAVPVKHGRWEEQTVDSYEENAVIAQWQSARCSECGRYLTTPYLYYFTKYNFCPECGAKMDGERRESK